LRVNNDNQEKVTTEFPLGTLLRFLYNSVAEEEEHHMAATGYDNIHVAHFPVLAHLYASPEGARITDLAIWAHITKPSMVYLVDYLAERGYVERVLNTSDKRAQMVQLTVRGQEAAAVLHQLNLNIEQKWQKQIGSQALSQFMYLLRNLVSLQTSEPGASHKSKK
jgi:DNA-binding MarR family transcriptional regulator